MRNKFFLLIIIVSCTGQKKNDELSHNEKISKDFFQINIESAEERSGSEYLSVLTSRVEYVQLETNKYCIIDSHATFLITDSSIFVNNLFHVLKYSREGKFLKQICIYGRGPGENEGIASISIIPKKKILAIQSSKVMLFFSLDGNFINSIKTPTFTNTMFITEDRYIAYFNGGLGYELYNFLLTDMNNDTLGFVENYFKWRNYGTSSWWSSYPYFEPFFKNMNRDYVKSIYNDTVYYISENKFIPGYYINLGKYKMPAEWIIERVMLQEPAKMDLLIKKAGECYYSNVFEVANKIFLTMVNFRSRKPKYLLFERGSEDSGYMLTNQAKGPSRIINDLDGGIDFWPEGKINDKIVYMALKVTDLKMKLDQNNKDQQDKIVTNAHVKFKKMVSDIDISDNPVLMIVTLK